MYRGNESELLLFTLFLHGALPHYVPKASVTFKGGLHKQLTKSIELSNPSKKPILYEVSHRSPLPLLPSPPFFLLPHLLPHNGVNTTRPSPLVLAGFL